MKNIDIMIVGAQKAGTTSLKNYLSQHPNVLSHPQMEMIFFCDEEHTSGYKAAFKKYFSFKPVNRQSKIVAKHASMYEKEIWIKRLQKHNPDCHIVFMLRDPVDRAYSSYQMEKSKGGENEDFENIVRREIVDEINSSRHRLYFELGQYAKYLRVILKYFDEKQITYAHIEEFKKQPLEEYTRILDELGLDVSHNTLEFKKHNEAHGAKSKTFSWLIRKLLRNGSFLKKIFNFFVSPAYNHKISNTLYRLNSKKVSFQPLDDNTRKILEEYYEPYNQDLEKILKRDLNHWRKSKLPNLSN